MSLDRIVLWDKVRVRLTHGVRFFFLRGIDIRGSPVSLLSKSEGPDGPVRYDISDVRVHTTKRTETR